MATFVYASVVCVLCFASVTVDAFLVSSSNSVRNYSRVDLVPNLRKYIEHEEIRLKVIKDQKSQKDEVPLVEKRIEVFKAMETSLKANKTNTLYQESLKANHPTTIFAAVRNYMSEFQAKYENSTLYGDRFREFMVTKDLPGLLPDKQDLHRVGMALSVIENVYNFSMKDLHQGLVGGHQGEALSAADCYDVAMTMINDGLLAGASQWLEAAISTIDLDKVKPEDLTFDLGKALAMLAKVHFARKDKDKCLKLYEKAVELDPDNNDLYQEYVSHRFGRNVDTLDELDVEAIEPWRKNFFGLCRKSLTLNDDKLFDIYNKTHPHLHCRYKASRWVPYSVYREEILNVKPFISIVHNFLSDSQTDALKDDTKDKLDHYVLPGNDRVTLWQFKGDLFKDNESAIVEQVSKKTGDVTGMNVFQKTKKSQVSYGEPIHIMDYGISGLALPHAEFKKEYHTHYMNIDNGKRYATVLVPLSDVKVGGATVFINQNVTIAPKKGMAVIYYSWNPMGVREDDLYVATCPLAVGENIVMEKGIWWTIYDKSMVCGKKKKSSHLAKERVLAQHKKLAAAQKPKLELSESYLQKYIAKLKADMKSTVKETQTIPENKNKKKDNKNKNNKKEKKTEKKKKEKTKEEKFDEEYHKKIKELDKKFKEETEFPKLNF